MVDQLSVDSLKLKTIHKCFLCPYIKGRSRCYASLHWEEYGQIRTWHIYKTGKSLYIVIEAVIRAFTTIEKQTTNHAK